MRPHLLDMACCACHAEDRSTSSGSDPLLAARSAGSAGASGLRAGADSGPEVLLVSPAAVAWSMLREREPGPGPISSVLLCVLYTRVSARGRHDTADLAKTRPVKRRSIVANGRLGNELGRKSGQYLTIDDC